MKKICPYCQKEFETNPTGGGHSRIPCFRPECIEKHKERKREYNRQKSEQYRKEGRYQRINEKSPHQEQKRENAKKPWPYYCQTCAKYGRKTKLKYPNRFNCPDCLRYMADHGVIDDVSEVYGGSSI